MVRSRTARRASSGIRRSSGERGIVMIEVAVPMNAPQKDKGDLLEAFAREFLLTQSYEVETQVRSTGAELDLLCRHRVNNRRVYVECKAHRDTLAANVLTSLVGIASIKKYDEAWLITAGPLGKDAKGLQVEWEERTGDDRQKLSIYTPERLIAAFFAAKLITKPPDKIDDLIGDAELALGTWTLVLTPFGRYWLGTITKIGVPTYVIVLKAETGTLVTDSELLSRIANTDCTLKMLDFERFSERAPTPLHPASTAADAVVEVAHGENWTDYRPARPIDFVGRTTQIATIFQLLEDVRSRTTACRIFAVTGDAGMGKSSLVAKLRDRGGNQRNRGKFFIFAVDSRAAKSANYVLSSLVAALRHAAEKGFGDLPPDEIAVSDYADPLSSESLQAFLKSMETKKQVVCLIFDQFEELYSKPELFDVFREAERLFFSTIAAKSSLVLGFAWRTDVTVPQEHPAYHMWHRLTDHRLETRLGPFSPSESQTVVTRFEKELKQGLHPELRRQLIENSQGYPWFLKKLCIHIGDQLKSGIRQSDLRETLDAAALFDRDLQELTSAQKECLIEISENAPADWFEVLNLYGQDVLRVLQDRRLVVRSGDRINVYWDVFRDFLLKKRPPPIPLTYLPSSPSLSALLKVAAELRHDEGRTVAELAGAASVVEKTVGNIVRDLIMFGIAAGHLASPKLDVSLRSNGEQEVLQHLRTTLRRHVLTLSLNRLESGTTVTAEYIAEELRRLNPTAKHRPHTWKLYAERLASWLTTVGFLVPQGVSNWSRKDLGGVSPTAGLRKRRKRGGFTGQAPPETVLSAIKWLSENRHPTFIEVNDAGHRNGLSVLIQFNLVRQVNGRYEFTRNLQNTRIEEILWRAAKEDSSLQNAVELLRKSPTLNGKGLGRLINESEDNQWTQGTIIRTGNALRRWALWIIKADDAGEILPPPRDRARRKRVANHPTLRGFEVDERPDEPPPTSRGPALE